MSDQNNKRPLTTSISPSAADPASDTQSAESQMRRALGLQGSSRQAPQQRADQARPRHRFVQDGGVPVVVLNRSSDSDPTTPLKARITELLANVEAERAAHAATRRTLQEAQGTIQALQTRIAHSDLAHADALAAERRARKDAEEQREEAAAPKPVAPKPVAVKPAVIKPPRAPRVARAAKPREAKPVKWWLPSFREKS
ncbi:MAG: hypothetical protein H7Z10_03310 [Gemmatimonadaceae bacterium]|nr:hypothetical protein [Acetobacteraceae bacterium]